MKNGMNFIYQDLARVRMTTEGSEGWRRRYMSLDNANTFTESKRADMNSSPDNHISSIHCEVTDS